MKEPTPFSIGTIILGGGALLLFGVLALGFLLPTDWEAEASTTLQGTYEEVFAYLDSPEGWQAWTPWPDSGLVREGPKRGVDARITWADPELGAGSFRLVEVRPNDRVSYAVEVGGGMRTEGSVSLGEDGDGIRVTWREEGNLGRNPIMGFWAFFMDRAQTTELEKGLVRLSELVAPARPGGPTTDSVSGGDP